MTEEEAIAILEDRVSRETMARLGLYTRLLEKWQGTINLVSATTLPVIWTRHILDSAQLWDQLDHEPQSWLDLGSGGGLPGLVCAAIASEKKPELAITLVEADVRKAAFLREAARQMELDVRVMSRRIEDLPPAQYDVITARALAPLDKLCQYAQPYLAKGGKCLFQKGARHLEELSLAQQDWNLSFRIIPSIADPASVIVKIEHFHHV